MQLRNALFGAALVGLTATITAAFIAQDPGDAPDMSALMPGEHHARLAYLAGEWEYSYTLEEPGQEPVKLTGSATGEMMYDGRFVKTTSTYDYMGMGVEDMILMGYDNFRQQYIMFYVSSWGTGWTQSTGQRNDQGDIIWNGTQDMPHMGLRDVGYRIIHRRVDDDTFQMEFWMQDESVDRGWRRNMVIDSTRRAAD